MTTPKAKVAISMDAVLLERVKAIVRDGRASSVSAYLAHAVAAQLAAEAHFDALLAEGLEASGGSVTRAERMQARRLLRGAA